MTTEKKSTGFKNWGLTSQQWGGLHAKMSSAAAHAARQAGADKSVADDAVSDALVRAQKSHPEDFPGDAYLSKVARGIVGELSKKKKKPEGDVASVANHCAAENVMVRLLDSGATVIASACPEPSPTCGRTILEQFETLTAQLITAAHEQPGDPVTSELVRVLQRARGAVEARDEPTLRHMARPSEGGKSSGAVSNAQRIQIALLAAHGHLVPARAAGFALETIAHLYPDLESVPLYRGRAGAQIESNARYRLRAWVTKNPAPQPVLAKNEWRASYSEAAVRIALIELSDSKTANAILGHARTPRSREREQSKRRMAAALALMGVSPASLESTGRARPRKSNK